ncbi:MAG TPA: carboxylesterase family protein, partial [Bryobacteraceae bacterium]|nr:carboxylesterase family protein [Bryobacteraceae bacterium]
MTTDRRSFMSALAAGCALAAKGRAQSQASSGAAARGSEMFCTAETQYGKIQGVRNTNIHEFKGVPYGASTGGKNRFMPPQKATAWTGVRECLAHGQISPQTITPPTSDYGQMIQWDLHYGTGMGEDVLTLNVWTPGIKDGAKRPVMVSFHGGGYATGSGNGPQYDGTQLAKLGDCVVVTVNHRLASFGYLHL